ncbi:hypothetical protein BC939DRAFT_446312 [Gamsiella multidivaricata]|uniref:uncharacterized protein n=1 Tax=Gamsiella multidivaricata TaxID=101098 RepID=UPI00221F0690|nr:uncharacterized protein BC939DRAFT_446312 [Gamsiella multidivaricata]KAG0369492.1 hypothetical protein BGZ54_009779 [Gamsiella multidivaricata]KAI7826952.1 hypothetical protein BC939DRAFT_446312 [Gamsiella multidivaricata]
MAKGLRSKSARKFRAIKRENVFGPVETARVHRLAERLKKDAQGPKTSELEAIARGEELMQVEKPEDTDMAEDKKISTSGRKDANHAKHKLGKEDRKKKNKEKLSKRELKKRSTFFRFHK